MAPLPATSLHATLTEARVTCPQSSAQSCPSPSPCSSPLVVSYVQHKIQPSYLCSLVLTFSLQPLPNASFQPPACLLLGLIILCVTLYHSRSLSQAPGFHVPHCHVCVCSVTQSKRASGKVIGDESRKEAGGQKTRSSRALELRVRVLTFHPIEMVSSWRISNIGGTS